MKKIGKYLIENRICDEFTLKRALEEQLKLKEKSVFKPLGSILAEFAHISRLDLERVLLQLHVDIMSGTPLFKDISKAAIEEALSHSEHKILPADTIIFQQGDPPDSYYFIISGRVNFFANADDGSESTLAVLQAGSGFGEISLLTGEPHRTSTKTMEPASILIISKENFSRICEQNAEIAMAFIKGFANCLKEKEAEIVKAGEKERAYQQFVSEQDELALPELIGQTRIINNLRAKINAAARNDQPVIIYGEPGTEVLVVAGNIHKNSPYASAPFLSMDAESIALEGYGAIREDDSDTLQLEIAQSSVLFGYEDQAFSFSRARGLGLLQICRQGSVVIRNIDKLTKGVQEKIVAYLQDGTFMTVGGRAPISSSARIIATSSTDLDAYAAEGEFNPDLLELLRVNQMTVPPISRRKSDLRLLVDFIIIMECFKTPDRKLIKGVSPEAYQRIMEYDWPGNMDELQIVIRRAINLARGDYLMPEDIFIGITPPAGKYTINLLKFAKMKNFFSSRMYPGALQAITVFVFSLILLMAFAGSQAPDSNVALLLVWGIWEPLLVVSWFFGARIWCAFCPMGAVNGLLNRVGGTKKLKVPAFLHEYGVYFSAAGLALIIVWQAATGMHYSPLDTGYLLLAIILFALASGILFERRAWCRYLCPLGKLGAVFAGCSVVEWRANSSICNSTCKDNSCYKGDDDTPGCPMYQGPFSLTSNQNCILCGNCEKSCPNDSPAFNLRIPGHELWAALKPEKLVTVFVPVIMGTQIFRSVVHTSFIDGLAARFQSGWVMYAVLMLGATAVSFAYLQVAGVLAFGRMKSTGFARGDLFIHAVIPLAFTYELAYQLKPLLTRTGHFLSTLGRQFGFDLEYWDFVYQPGAVKPWQVLLLLVGTGASMAFLKALVNRHQENNNERLGDRMFGYMPIILLGCAYTGLFILQ